MAAPRPQDLIFTLFGDYLLRRPPVWVGTLLALLQPMGLSANAVRTALSRMTRKGWLRARRVGRRSYYELTDRGRQLLEEGEARIHHPPRPDEWDGRWYVFTYSIPELQRKLRDRLRVRFTWLGLGQLGNGVWITPHDVRAQVRALAESMEVARHVEVFRAEHLGFTEPASLVSRCWDLDDLNQRYATFIGMYGPEHERHRKLVGGDLITPGDCFVRRFCLIHEYRVFPFLDPYLPRELLPADWRGEEALELFESIHELLRPGAERFVDAVYEPLPSDEPSSDAARTVA